MLKCVHLDVMFVTKRLLFNKILSVIKSSILRNDRITVMCVICHSFPKVFWNDTCLSIIMTIHIPVICVVKVLIFGVA